MNDDNLDPDLNDDDYWIDSAGKQRKRISRRPMMLLPDVRPDQIAPSLEEEPPLIIRRRR